VCLVVLVLVLVHHSSDREPGPARHAEERASCTLLPSCAAPARLHTARAGTVCRGAAEERRRPHAVAVATRPPSRAAAAAAAAARAALERNDRGRAS
jgi:hypothetical protein